MEVPERDQTLTLLGFEVTLKCAEFPELYEVTRRGQFIGHLHLRHDEFRVTNAGEHLVYRASPLGSGFFMDHEREYYLVKAVRALKADLDNPTPRYVNWRQPVVLRGFAHGEARIIDVNLHEGTGVVSVFIAYRDPQGHETVDVLGYDEGRGVPLNPIFHEMDMYYIDNVDPEGADDDMAET